MELELPVADVPVPTDVTHMSEHQIEGARFGLVLQNAVGLDTDFWPLDTFLVER